MTYEEQDIYNAERFIRVIAIFDLIGLCVILSVIIYQTISHFTGL